MKKVNRTSHQFFPFGVFKYKRKRGPSQKPPTIAQLEHQKKFGVAAKFLSHVRKAIPIITCKRKKRDYDRYLAKMVHGCGFTGVFPNYELDYSNLELTSPGLGEMIYDAKWCVQGVVQINWDMWNSEANDDVFVFAYNATAERSHIFSKIAVRKDLEVKVEIPDYCEDDVVHIWVFFKSTDNQSSSRSVYFKLDTSHLQAGAEPQ